MLNYFGFGNKSSLGLHISDDSIKYIELIKDKGTVNIGRFGEREIPKGVIQFGRIKDKEWLKQILLLLKKEENFETIHISLPYEILEKGEEENKDIEDGVLESALREYIDVFKESKIKPLSMEMEAKSIYQSVIPREDKDTYMIVDFGRNRTGISVVSNGNVLSTAISSFNGVDVTSMIKEELELSDEEAEKIKRQHGLKRNIPNKRLTQVFLDGFHVLIDEVKKHFVNWHLQKDKEKNPNIKKIILCGSESTINGLSEHLAISLQGNVEIANVWVNVLNTEKNIPEIDFNKSFIFTPAIGVALNGFKK